MQSMTALAAACTLLHSAEALSPLNPGATRQLPAFALSAPALAGGQTGALGVSGLKALEFASPEVATFPQQIFTLVNFAVLPFWGLMIFSPKWEVTQQTMRSTWPILICGLMHLSMVSYGLSQPGSMEEFQFLATQGFVKLSAMQEMRQYPVFVSEEWAHVLAWSLSPTARRAALLCPLQASSAATHDPVCVRCLKAKNVHAFHRDLFVGRYVYLDGLEKDIPTPHSLFFTFLLGPLGLSLHLITRAIVTKDPSSILRL